MSSKDRSRNKSRTTYNVYAPPAEIGSRNNNLFVVVRALNRNSSLNVHLAISDGNDGRSVVNPFASTVDDLTSTWRIHDNDRVAVIDRFEHWFANGDPGVVKESDLKSKGNVGVGSSPSPSVRASLVILWIRSVIDHVLVLAAWSSYDTNDSIRAVLIDAELGMGRPNVVNLRIEVRVFVFSLVSSLGNSSFKIFLNSISILLVDIASISRFFVVDRRHIRIELLLSVCDGSRIIFFDILAINLVGIGIFRDGVNVPQTYQIVNRRRVCLSAEPHQRSKQYG
jgi:hypothetical protein